MSIRHSLLALLQDQPRYGYQLRTEFENRTGSTWPLNIGQVYTTLDRLERDAQGRLRIVDFKTGRHVPTQARVDEMDQLGIYQLAAQQDAQDDEGLHGVFSSPCVVVGSVVVGMRWSGLLRWSRLWAPEE